MVSVMLTAVDIPGAELSEPLVHFWHHYQESEWNETRDCDLSWLSSLSNLLREKNMHGEVGTAGPVGPIGLQGSKGDM